MREPRTAKRMLKMLDDFFSSENIAPKEHARLWNILTALRGPDWPDPNGQLKAETTEKIRLLALPNSSYNVLANFAPSYKLPTALEELERLPSGHDHFWDHVYAATLALRRIADGD